MSKLTNKIEAHDRRVSEVLENKKYTVDYFQREYNWQKKHIEQLIIDLTNAFLSENKEGDARTEGQAGHMAILGIRPATAELAGQMRPGSPKFLYKKIEAIE